MGFQPKIVLFFWGGSTGTGDGVAGGNINIGFGVATGSASRWSMSGISTDGAAASDTRGRLDNENCIYCYTNATPTIDGIMDFSSMDADGFTLVVDDQFANAYRISYLALGGTDLTNVFVGTNTTPTSTGNYSETGVGFQPECLITAMSGTTGPGSSADLFYVLGMATGSSNQGVVTGYSADGLSDTATLGYGYNGECNGLGGTARESFVSFDADGFTLNHLEGTTAYYYGYICLKGGQYVVSDLTTRTDGNDIAETVGFQPVALLFASANRALSTQDARTNHHRLSIGAGTGASERACAAWSDENALADTETAYANYDTAVYAQVVDDAVVGLMDIKSIDASGFTCVMDDTDPSGCWVTYLAIGAAESGEIEINLDAAAITASGQALSITKGAVSKALDAGEITTSGPQLSITKGAVTKNLASGQVTAGGQAITLQTGAVIKNLNAAVLSAAGQPLAVTSGAITINLASGQITAGGQAITITPGAFSLALDAAAIAAAGQPITLTTGVLTVNLDAAALLAEGQATTLTPGAVSVALDAADLTASGQVITITIISGTVVYLDVAALQAGGQAISLVPGAVSLGMDAAALLAGGQTLTLLPGAVSTGLDAAAILSSGLDLSVSPGAVSIPLDAAVVVVSGPDMAIYAIIILIRDFAITRRARDIEITARLRDIAISKPRQRDISVEVR